MWKSRWEDEYRRAVETNSQTRTVVPARKNDLRIWKGYLKTRDGRLHSLELKLEFPAQRDGRTMFYPLSPPLVEWQTPIHHPNIQPPRPAGEGVVCLAPLDPLHPERWNPKTHIVELLNWIEVLVNSPDPSDPINHPVCLLAAIAMIRDMAKGSPHEGLERQLAEAAALIRKYERIWNNLKSDAERRERDRAWYLVVEAGKRLSAKTPK